MTTREVIYKTAAKCGDNGFHVFECAITPPVEPLVCLCRSVTYAEARFLAWLRRVDEFLKK